MPTHVVGTAPRTSALRAAGCRALRDPVRAFSIFLILSSLVQWGVAMALLWPSPDASDAVTQIVVFGLVFGLLTLLGPLGYWVLLWEPRRAVFMVRAFESDERSRRLHGILRAAAGPRLRLCGIRSPRRRTPVWSRFLLWGWTALRYIGSPAHQLEAEDGDWAVRLLAWLPRARCVVVDMRHTTPFVEMETALCAEAVGLDRCAFIVDDTQTPDQWRARIHSVTGAGEAPSPESIVSINEDSDLATAVEGVRAAIENTPRSRPVIPAELARAQLSSANSALLPTPWLERDIGHGAVFALLTLIVNLIPGLSVMGILMGLALFVLYVLAFVRSWRMLSLPATFRRAGQRSPRVRLVVSGVLVGLSIIAYAVLLPAMQNANRTAKRVLTMARMKQLWQGAMVFESDHNRMPRSLNEIHAAGIYDDAEFAEIMTNPQTGESPGFMLMLPDNVRSAYQVRDPSSMQIIWELRDGTRYDEGLRLFIDGSVEFPR